MAEQILFVFFEAGSGHRVVAEAVADAIKRNPLNRYDVRLLEFFEETGLSRIESITKNLYNEFLLRHRFLYTCYYHLGNTSLIIRILRRLFLGEQFWCSIERIIAQNNPRMCVLANPYLSECFYRVASRKKRAPLLVNLVSDPFSIHSLWLSPNADFNLMFSTKARKAFIKRGIPESKIETFDYPVHLKFSECVHSREDILAGHRFSPEKLTILIYAGWHNKRLVLEIIRRILRETWPVQVFVVLGKDDGRSCLPMNPDLHNDSSIRVFDYTDNMDMLIAASDMIACKAGPAIIFEAINMKKPMAVLSYVPGQERGNVDFILGKNFGWYCNTAEKFLRLLGRILDDPVILEDKRSALERSAVSNGAPMIAQFLMDVLAG
jgi:UDP-N-acetylglucosamine:LPS N-acetylglucosamine transferase